MTPKLTPVTNPGQVVIYVNAVSQSIVENLHLTGTTITNGQTARVKTNGKMYVGGNGKVSSSFGGHLAAWAFFADTVSDGNRKNLYNNGYLERLRGCKPRHG